MSKQLKQFYDIKFPFTYNNDRAHLIDLNEKFEDKVLSEILHVILTPKKIRLRMPEFGTDLAKFIYEPSDSMSWDKIKQEVRQAVVTYVPGATINDIQVLKSEEDEHKFGLEIDYSVKIGIEENNYRAAIKL